MEIGFDVESGWAKRPKQIFFLKTGTTDVSQT